MSSLRIRLRTATHSAGGVPRLFRAGLAAGLGMRGAVQVVAISARCLAVAAERGAGEPGRQNAVRHFVWQALLTARFGRDAAQRIALAQEHGTATPRDSEVDQHNNYVGQEYGAAHQDSLRDLSTGAALDALVPVALATWAGGALA